MAATIERMKILLPQLAAGAIAGAIGGLAAGLAASGAAASDPTSTGPVRDQSAAAIERNALLESRIEDLEARLRAAEMRKPTPAPTERVAAAPVITREEFEELMARVDGMTAAKPKSSSKSGKSLAKGDPVFDDAFEDQVREALEQVRFEETVAKVRNDQERRIGRIDEDVAALTERLGLSRSQADEMHRALSTQYERETELVRRWQEGVADDILGEEKGTMYADFQADLESFLDEEQVTGFWAAASASAGGKGG